MPLPTEATSRSSLFDRLLKLANKSSNDLAVRPQNQKKVVLFEREADFFVDKVQQLPAAERVTVFQELAKRAKSNEVILSVDAAKALNDLGTELNAKKTIKANYADELAKVKAAALARGLNAALKTPSVRDELPAYWAEALVSIKANGLDVTVTYDYEAFAGSGLGECEHLAEMQSFLDGVIENTPSLEKYKKVSIDFWGPQAT